MTEIRVLCDYREDVIQKQREVDRLRLSSSLLKSSEMAADVERWQFALTLVHDAMSIRVEHLGLQSAKVADCLGALSRLHARQKQFDLAIRYGTEQLDHLTQILGDTHPDTEAADKWLSDLCCQGDRSAKEFRLAEIDHVD